MDYMARAIELAVRAKRICKPNPAVGAVIVRDGQIVGEGFTQPVGHAHAEIVALDQAGPHAEGASLYATLEPCSHHGRTAPCIDAILAAGIREVHASMVDPSPWVNGRGIAVLESAGLDVTLGEKAGAAWQLNAGYFTWVERGRPLVTAMYEGSLEQARELSSSQLEIIVPDSLEALAEDADRLVVDRSDGFDDLSEWPRALGSLAGQSVQHVILDTSVATLESLAGLGLIDRIVLLPRFGGRQVNVANDRRSRIDAITVNGLVACSAVS